MVTMKVHSHKKVPKRSARKGFQQKTHKEMLKKSAKKVLKRVPKKGFQKKSSRKSGKKGLKKVQIKVMSLFKALKKEPKKVFFLRKVQKRAL